MGLKAVPGYAGYSVDSCGNVFSCKSNKWLTPVLNRGYHIVCLYNQGKSQTVYVHKLVAMTFLTNPKMRREVNHKNGVKTDNRAENLEWCTRSENIQHAFDTGLKHGMRGESQGAAKLTEEDVLEIRRLHASGGLTHQELADMFQVSRRTVGNAITRKTWGHLR